MVDTKITEREYTIPLRRFWVNVPHYERTGKAIKTIKIFVAKHMKLKDRDVDNVKLDVYFNNELWFRGRANPPAKVKVRVVKEGEIVKVSFVEMPQYVKFLKAKNERRHKASEKIVEAKEVPKEAKTEEQKKEESEKEKAVAEQHSKDIKLQARAEKHTGKIDKSKTHPQRMALEK